MSHHEVTLTIHIHYTGRVILDPYALTDPPISVNLYPWCCYTPCFILKPRPGSEGSDPTSWKKSTIGQIQRYDGTHFSKKSNIQHMQKYESIPFAKKSMIQHIQKYESIPFSKKSNILHKKMCWMLLFFEKVTFSTFKCNTGRKKYEMLLFQKKVWEYTYVFSWCVTGTGDLSDGIMVFVSFYAFLHWIVAGFLSPKLMDDSRLLYDVPSDDPVRSRPMYPRLCSRATWRWP